MIPGSFRILRKHWKLTAIAVFSLSIAMALGILSLSVSNTFLLLAPAAPEPDRLVNIYARAPGEDISHISYPDYKYFRENNHVFTDVAAAPNSISVNTNYSDGRETKVISRPVSDNYFAVLGIRPYLGRLFAPGDDVAKTPIAVMTYACWKRLGADRNIVGKEVTGRTIIGVTPESFTGSFYGLNGDLLLPVSSNERDLSWMTRRDARPLLLLARLKPGISRRQAQAEMAALSGQLATAFPKEDKDRTAVVTRATLLPPDAIPTIELGLGLLMLVVLLVLLIACANVANLLLAVAVGRRQEAAIKLALGAPRGRIIREFLAETAFICAASTVLGYAAAAMVVERFATITVDLLVAGSYSAGLNLHLDGTVLGATGALLLIAILATGLAPALYASSPGVAQILGGELVVGGTGKHRRRTALVIVQVGVCTLVLVGMGLCERSLYNLRRVDPGFSARNLAAVPVFPAQEGRTEAQGKQLYGTLTRTISALPGVESVSLASTLPVLLGFNEIPVQFPNTGKKISVKHSFVDADYFSTLGIRILSGRVFNSGDRENAPDVVVINRNLAQEFWPGQNPLGKTVLAGDPARQASVVGVVADGKYEDLDEPARPFLYYALSQHYQNSVDLVVRTQGDPRLWIQPVSKTVKDAGLESILAPFTFESWINLALLVERITAGCMAALGALGLLLAVMGLFGAISYSVSERKKELGIRVALGAQRWHLLQMVLRQTLGIAAAGVAIGVLLGVGATVLLRSQLYGIGAVEWTVLVPVSAAMLAVSLLVAYVSARPWISINPMEAVRHA